MTARWRDTAACSLADARLFDPVDSRTDPRRVRQARTICGGCTVRNECITHALTEGLSGIYGGRVVEYGRILRARQVATREATQLHTRISGEKTA